MKERLTLDQFIEELKALSAKGFGDREVWVNDEYYFLPGLRHSVSEPNHPDALVVWGHAPV